MPPYETRTEIDPAALKRAWWNSERRFSGRPECLSEAREWCRGLFPDECVLEEFLLVVSELFGNCVRHGGDGDVSLKLVHDGRGKAVGVLVHHTPPERVPVMRKQVVREIDRLLEGDVPDLDELAEDGRGLPVVDLLCTGGFEHRRTSDSSVFVWTIPCPCGPSHE